LELTATLYPGLHSASPLTLWLRVPLSWYTSATFAQFPDETRTSIQRSFVSPFTSSHRRVFCGYCGTQLSSWNEAEYISLTVGSLLDDDQNLLDELGFLPHSESSDEEDAVITTTTSTVGGPSRSTVNTNTNTITTRGAPWFEEMVRNTRLGRFKQQRGRYSTSHVQVEFEVSEWNEADDEGHVTPSKRKIGHVEAADEDSDMRNV
jgi:hypothetical protein